MSPFLRRLRTLWEKNGLFDKGWVVYAKRPFGGPEAVLAYLRYTHRVGISNVDLEFCTLPTCNIV